LEVRNGNRGNVEVGRGSGKRKWEAEVGSKSGKKEEKLKWKLEAETETKRGREEVNVGSEV
jgi:hypothetical protein